MLRPLFAQEHNRYGTLSKHLRLALEWWLDILGSELRQRTPWFPSERRTVQLFVDASGAPAHLGAVILVDGELEYTDWRVPQKLLEIFTSRRNNQIQGLEMLAAALGLSTFSKHCESRTTRLWSDNVSAEYSIKKGSARSFDHSTIAHCIWKQAAQLHTELWISRVPSKENIADLPSRQQFELLNNLGAKWVSPKLADDYWQPDSWHALKLRHEHFITR